MSSTTSRRAVLAGIAASPALAAPALASHASDARLRELWAQYLEHLAADQAACLAMAMARAAYDAEEPPCPPNVLPFHHSEAFRPLWKKRGLDRLFAAWNAAGERADEIVKAIREEEAEGLFGIGVKLAALPVDGNARDDAPDHEDAIVSALSEIDRMIGTTFVSSFSVHIHNDDESGAEETAVQS
jgi:hypothetical protein